MHIEKSNQYIIMRQTDSIIETHLHFCILVLVMFMPVHKMPVSGSLQTEVAQIQRNSLAALKLECSLRDSSTL